MNTTRHRRPEDPENPIVIDVLRKEIDAIDEEILNLVNRRLSLARQIGAHKKAHGNPVLDEHRENEILARLDALNNGPMDNDTLRHIFCRIIMTAREIQK